jgi:hypothetical protein
MTGRRDRLDRFVRQATRLGEDQTSMLVDHDRRQAILEEITRMQADESRSLPHGPHRRRLQLAAILAVVAAVAVVALGSIRLFGAADSTPLPVASGPTEQGGAPSGDVFGSGGGLSCVEQYSPQALAGRGFAFAGTVASIGDLPTSSVEVGLSVPVTFTVNRWFRGGQGDQVTVKMFPPDVASSAGNTPYKVGSSLLVSGERSGVGERPDELLAWACGFTRWHSQTEADDWATALR